MATFAARHPRIEIFVDESPRYVDLATERYDLALRTGALADSSLVARRLFAAESGIFASPSYLERRPRPQTPAELAGHELVLLEGRTRFDRFELRNGDRREEVALAGRITVTSTVTLRELAIRGAGPIVHWVRSFEDDVRARRLVRLLPDWSTEPVPVWIVTASRRLLPRKTMLFIEHLLAAFGSKA